jgi:hypothetical protein
MNPGRHFDNAQIRLILLCLIINIVIARASVAGLAAAHVLLQGLSGAKVFLMNPSVTFFWVVTASRIVSKPKAFQAEQYLLPIRQAFARYPKESFESIAGFRVMRFVE